MANPNWSLGRTGQVYVKAESSYGTAPTLGATSAVRHLSINLQYNPKSPAKSPERHTHPSQLTLLQRRQTAAFDLKAQLYPSGTLNTLPEADALLAAGFGQAATSTVLATTVSGAPSPTATGATVASATGLATGQFVRITTGGVVYIRYLTGVSGSALTWAPALPGAPLAGDAVVGCVTYALANGYAPTSLDVAHYPQAPAASAPKREQLGCVVNKMSFQFDSNAEPIVQFSGQAQGYASSPQAQPGGFTTVGAEGAIPSGLFGFFYFNGTLYQIEKFHLDVDNMFELQNTALGTSKPTAALRKAKRAVTVKVNAKVSDDLTIWTPSLTAAVNPLMLQLGTTAAQIWGLYCPNVEPMKVPDTPDGDETNNWDFEFTALGTNGNDEVSLGQC